MLKRILAGAITGLLLFSGVSMAADDSDITVTESAFNNKMVKEVIWYTTYDIGGSTGTAYDYNDQQGATDADGRVECRKYNKFKTVMIDVITLGSTSIDVRIEGRLTGTGEWGELITKNFTATTGANGAYVQPILEGISDIRVGVKANTAGTDSVTITGLLIGDNR